jgi:dihydroxyacetone kinase
MSTIYNDPAEFSDDATDGFVDLYSRYVRRVTGGVVRRARPATPKVAVVTGGGSGHYPAFCGVVGPGFADGAVIGNIFTSPSTAQAYSVGRAADSGAGVVFTYGNYAGDVMNFGLAGERLTDSGIPSRQVIVTDDIASAPPEEREKRRGIAGDVVVFKTMSAAAEEGADLDEVVRIGTRTNDATYTIGVAFDGCTFPGADHKHFTVPEGKMGLGLGIHGEPGQRDIDWLPAANLAALLVQRLLDERPPAAGPRVAVILNGLGATKYEELFVLWAAVARLLREAGLTLVGPEVGELVTSLDMAGVSLTLTWLDEELERLWLAPCDTPAFRRGSIGGTGAAEATRDEEITDEVIHDDTEPPRRWPVRHRWSAPSKRCSRPCTSMRPTWAASTRSPVTVTTGGEWCVASTTRSPRPATRIGVAGAWPAPWPAQATPGRSTPGAPRACSGAPPCAPSGPISATKAARKQQISRKPRIAFWRA